MGSDSKSSGFFSSVLNTNYGLWTGISSKLEAALNLSLEVLDTNKSDSASQNTVSSSCAQSSGHANTINQEKAFHKRRVSQYVAETQNYVRRQKLKAGRKDRSIYGQPEIEKVESPVSKPKPTRDLSQESLEGTDSGNSNCDNSIVSVQENKKKISDPFLVFRHTDSVGIGSESDTCGPSTSVDSSDVESLAEGACMERSGSDGSIHSWNSSSSTDSQGDEAGTEAMEFMKTFVEKIFKESALITYEEKAAFGIHSQQETGRLWFTRYVNAKRVGYKRVPESAFYSLVQYFAIILFECAEADDFSPAKNLMNMCFTFYNDVSKEGQTPRKQYPYMYLKQQPIWKSLRFWNAAFFDAVQCERAHRRIPTRNDFGLEELLDEKRFQQNITFGQLGTFTCNMHAFDLNQELCLEFLRKQCVIANLPKDQVALLRENIDRMYNSEPS